MTSGRISSTHDVSITMTTNHKTLLILLMHALNKSHVAHK